MPPRSKPTPTGTSTPSPTPSPFLARWFGAILLGIFALVLALNHHLFAPGELLGDDNSIHLAEIHTLASALRSGHLSMWNSSGNLGFPSAFYYQSLPQWTVALLDVVTFGKLGILLCFKLIVALCLALPPVATAWAARRTGRTYGQALGIAVALVFVGGRSRWGYGTDSLFTTGIFTQTFAFIFFGPALLLLDAWIRDGQKRDGALAFTFTLLCGLAHPFLGIVLGLWAIFRRWRRAELRAEITRLVLLGAVLILGTASLWLPILVDYDSFGGFPARVAFEEGVPPRLFAPIWAKGELLDLQRLPILTWLAIGGLAFAPARRYALLGLFAACAIMIGPSLGKTKDDLFPMVRFLAPMQFAFAIAGGIVLAELARRLRLWLVDHAAWQTGIAVIAFIALFGFELIPRLQLLANRPQVSRDANVARDELDGLMETLRTLPHARTQVSSKLGTGNHFWAYLPYAYADQPSLITWGGAALQSSPNYVYLHEELDWQTNAQLYDAPYIFYRKVNRKLVPPNVQELAENHGYILGRLPSPGLLSGVAITGTLPKDRFERRKANFLWIRSPQAKAGEYFEYVGSSLPHNPASVVVTNVEDSPSRYRFTLKVDQPGAAVVRVSYHPRWRATIDGNAVKLGRLSPDVIGVELPSGDHVLELRFVRPGWHYALDVFTPLLVVALLLAARLTSRKSA